MLGDGAVGKTSIIRQYMEKYFTEEHANSTIGVDVVKRKYIAKDGKEVNVKIWDTAGQERFRTLPHSFYKDANGVVLVFDVSDSKTYRGVEKWVN